MTKALGERYLSYALSTITSRSLPDVRDGLKPVQRRILYAMGESGNFHNKPPRKSASAVGYVMMKYHPHGEGAIYDSIVRLAQSFSSRYPLVQGQGNFGSIDGDSAAAMRYTEARLSPIAEALLKGLKQECVDFRPTYNGEDKEPVVLPSAFPNLLANGTTGIAVGMATNIPPHNVGEVIAALRYLIKHPGATTQAIVKRLPGPDFPTGGVLIDDSSVFEKAYETGRGGFYLRARWEKEDLKGGLYQLVVTEIPYQIQKSKLIERIAELLIAKKLPLLSDMRDESTQDVRIIFEPRSRNVDPELLMEMLFKATDLETRFSLNMNVLDAGGVPRVMKIQEVLQAFLDHRHEVLVLRSEHRLRQIARRLEILEGFRIAFLNLDEVIAIIRQEDEPKPVLMKRFSLSDVQTEAILNMRLRSLRRLEEMEIVEEIKGLTGEQSGLQDLLSNEEKRWGIVDQELKEVSKSFSDSRRSSFEKAPEGLDVSPEAFVEKEPVTIVCSKKGWIRALKGHVQDTSDVKHRQGDEGRFAIKAYTTDKLLVVSPNGRVYTLGVDRLPGGRSQGEPLGLLLNWDPGAPPPVDIVPHRGQDRRWIIASNIGRGFIVQEKDLVAQTRNGRQVINLNEGEQALRFFPIKEGDDHVAVMGENRKLLIFQMDQLPEMSRGRGVFLQRYKDGGLSDVKSFKLEEGLTWQRGPQTRCEKEVLPWLGNRAQSGRLPPGGFSRTNKFTDS
ncbi:MAG: DNA topoisomerase IV subunit A [bacterium]|nr:DNA topoisomerase IV subunit A [bacterium]